MRRLLFILFVVLGCSICSNAQVAGVSIGDFLGAVQLRTYRTFGKPTSSCDSIIEYHNIEYGGIQWESLGFFLEKSPKGNYTLSSVVLVNMFKNKTEAQQLRDYLKNKLTKYNWVTKYTDDEPSYLSLGSPTTIISLSSSYDSGIWYVVLDYEKNTYSEEVLKSAGLISSDN